jgi:hypothetical protein
MTTTTYHDITHWLIDEYPDELPNEAHNLIGELALVCYWSSPVDHNTKAGTITAADASEIIIDHYNIPWKDITAIATTI